MILSVIVIAYLLWRLFSGWNRGFAQTLLRTIGSILIWLAATMFAKPLGQVIANIFGVQLKTLTSSAVGSIGDFSVTNSSVSINDAIVTTVSSMIGFFLIMTFGSFVINLIASGLRSIRRMSFLGWIDGLFGAALSLLIGAFIVYLSLKVITTIPWQNGFLADQLKQAPWVQKIVNFNLIKIGDIIGWLTSGDTNTIVKTINNLLK